MFCWFSGGLLVYRCSAGAQVLCLCADSAFQIQGQCSLLRYTGAQVLCLCSGVLLVQRCSACAQVSCLCTLLVRLRMSDHRPVLSAQVHRCTGTLLVFTGVLLAYRCSTGAKVLCLCTDCACQIIGQEQRNSLFIFYFMEH